MEWKSHVTLALYRRVVCGCWILMAAPLLSACSLLDLHSERTASAPSYTLAPTLPIGEDRVTQGLPMDDFLPAGERKEKVRERERLGLTAQQSRALGCSIRDRFDRSAALAYNFSDEQSRLALQLGVNGPSFSNPGRFEVNRVMVRFTYQLEKPSPAQKAKCLYPSGFQGLVGSVYNEFFVRENYTIWHELRDRGLNLK